MQLPGVIKTTYTYDPYNQVRPHSALGTGPRRRRRGWKRGWGLVAAPLRSAAPNPQRSRQPD